MTRVGRPLLAVWITEVLLYRIYCNNALKTNGIDIEQVSPRENGFLDQVIVGQTIIVIASILEHRIEDL